MQRRLVVTLVGVVVVGLFLAGLGTVFQARLDRQSFTRDQLADRAKSTTAFIDETLMTTDRSPFGRERLRRITHALGVSEFGLLIVNETSSEPLVVLAALPDGLDFASLDLEELFANGTSSGALAGRAWAASLSKTSLPNEAAALVVLAGEYDDALGDAVRWFLFAAFATIILAVFVALRLSKQMAQPIIEATKTAGRLADGDLTSRLPQPDPQETDEAADLARAINAMAANLERARGVERQFLLSVSHDLRTPMTSIQGYAEALTDGTSTDAQRAGAIILSESRRLDRLVRDLLELARLDARQFTMHQQSIDLSQAAQRSLDGFRPSAQEADIDLVFSSAPSAAHVNVDPDRLAQVMANLIENALRYTTSRITLGVALEGGYATLSVIDNGPGIADEDLAHVFERLYVSRHQPKNTESGSGLGLAIVRELVEAMEGTVQVTSTLGSGTTMTVSFPLLP